MAIVAVLLALPTTARASDFSPLFGPILVVFSAPLLLLGVIMSSLRHPFARALVHFIGVVAWLLGLALATGGWPRAGMVYAPMLALYSWIAWFKQRPPSEG